jgi:hypothetical protein
MFNIQYHPVDSTDWTVINDVSSPFTVSNLLVCTEYEFEVQVICGATAATGALPFTWTSEGCCAPPDGIPSVSSARTAGT